MERTTLQQEILLVITSKISGRQMVERDERNNKDRLSKEEQLEADCWNGLIDELLPEVIRNMDSGKRLYVWNIRQGPSFLQVELSEFPVLVEKEYSINTIFFLPTVSCN